MRSGPSAADHEPGNDRHLVRASADVWESTDLDGIEVRCLAVDEDNDRITAMILHSFPMEGTGAQRRTSALSRKLSLSTAIDR